MATARGCPRTVVVVTARKPTPAQRAVLERLRDEEVYYLATSPRRCGISKPTLEVLFAAEWVELDGETVRGKGRLLVLTEAGKAAITS